MQNRIRLDLEGIGLTDHKGRLLASFRFRTQAGITVHLPESADVTLSWDELSECRIDLRKGQLVLGLSEAGQRAHRWLQGATELRGQWLDRIELDGA